jgi:hypothetical protein
MILAKGFLKGLLCAKCRILLILHNKVEVRKNYDMRNLCGFEAEWKIIMTRAVITQTGEEQQQSGRSH